HAGTRALLTCSRLAIDWESAMSCSSPCSVTTTSWAEGVPAEPAPPVSPPAGCFRAARSMIPYGSVTGELLRWLQDGPSLGSPPRCCAVRLRSLPGGVQRGLGGADGLDLAAGVLRGDEQRHVGAVLP